MESETRQIPRGCAWYTYAAVDAPVPSMTRIASDWILWRHRILFIALTFYHPILTSSTIFSFRLAGVPTGDPHFLASLTIFSPCWNFAGFTLYRTHIEAHICRSRGQWTGHIDYVSTLWRKRPSSHCSSCYSQLESIAPFSSHCPFRSSLITCLKCFVFAVFVLILLVLPSQNSFQIATFQIISCGSSTAAREQGGVPWARLA